MRRTAFYSPSGNKIGILLNCELLRMASNSPYHR